VVVASALGATTARGARADPQTSFGVTFGAALNDAVGPRSLAPAVHLGARGDVLLLRSNPRQMGVGPYVDVATGGFESIDAGAGVSWLLPLLEDVPLVLSGGGFARNGQERTWAPGLEGTLFAGSRSFNYHSVYGMALGFFAQSRWIPASPATLDVVLGVQLDLEVLALPVLFVINGFR
jgi:hypothetical protein